MPRWRDLGVEKRGALVSLSMLRLGKDPATKSHEFSEKCHGGGVIFNPKIYVADFGNFKQGFLSTKLIEKSNFRVQGKGRFVQEMY